MALLEYSEWSRLAGVYSSRLRDGQITKAEYERLAGQRPDLTPQVPDALKVLDALPGSDDGYRAARLLGMTTPSPGDDLTVEQWQQGDGPRHAALLEAVLLKHHVQRPYFWRDTHCCDQTDTDARLAFLSRLKDAVRRARPDALEELAEIDRQHVGAMAWRLSELAPDDPRAERLSGELRTAVGQSERDYAGLPMALRGIREAGKRFMLVGRGMPMPELVAMLPNGAPATLSAQRGQWVLLDFWATWCGPCLKEQPLVNKVADAWKDLPISIIGVNVDKDVRILNGYLGRTPLAYPQWYVDPETARDWGVSSYPTYMLVSPDGTLAAQFIHFEPDTADRIRKMIAAS